MAGVIGKPQNRFSRLFLFFCCSETTNVGCSLATKRKRSWRNPPQKKISNKSTGYHNKGDLKTRTFSLSDLFFSLIIGSRWEGVPRQYPQRTRTDSKLLRPPGVHAVDQGEFLVNFWLDRINKSDRKIVAFLSCCCKYENATPTYIGIYVPCYKCNWNNFCSPKVARYFT